MRCSGYRALDHHHQLRLVRGCAHETPGAVLDCYAHAIHGDQFADRLAGDLLAFRLGRFEVLHHRVDHRILFSSSQCGAIVGEPQVFGSALRKSAMLLSGLRSSMSQHREREDHAVVVTATKRLVEKKCPDFSKPAIAPSSLTRRLM